MAPEGERGQEPHQFAAVAGRPEVRGDQADPGWLDEIIERAGMIREKSDYLGTAPDLIIVDGAGNRVLAAAPPIVKYLPIDRASIFGLILSSQLQPR